MIQLVLSLTSFPHIALALEPLPMVHVILTLLLSVAKGGPPGLALETVNIQKARAEILAQHAQKSPTPEHYIITPCASLLPVPTLITFL